MSIINLPLIQVLFYPIVEIIKQVNAIQNHNKSIFQCILVMVFVMCGTICGSIGFFYFMSDFNVFFDTIAAPYALKATIGAYLSSLVLSGIAGFTVKNLIKLCCYLLLGDPVYYLTKKKEAELEEILKEQGYILSRNTIRRIVEHCVKKIHSPPSEDIGINKKDWKIVLKAFLHDNDIEPFLEQQIFIINRIKKTQDKMRILQKHSGAFDHEALVYSKTIDTEDATQALFIPTPPPISTSITASSSSKKSLLASLKPPCNIGEIFRTPRKTEKMEKQAQSVRIQETEALQRSHMESKEKLLVLNILNRFKHHRQNQSGSLQVGDLLGICYDDLKNKELTLKTCCLTDTEHAVRFIQFFLESISCSAPTSPYRTSSSVDSQTPIVPQPQTPCGEFRPLWVAFQKEYAAELLDIENSPPSSARKNSVKLNVEQQSIIPSQPTPLPSNSRSSSISASPIPPSYSTP